MTLTITLPLPDPVLNPNGRKHWRAIAAAKKKARENARIHALAALGRRTPPRWKEAIWSATFYFKDARRRDKDNFISAMKAHRDGVADAGVVENDSGFVLLPAVFCVDKARPRVEVEIREFT